LNGRSSCGGPAAAGRRPSPLLSCLGSLALALAVLATGQARAEAAEAAPATASAARPDDFAPFADAALEARYRGLIARLRCLVCQNESLADSHAPLASDLRREVRGMLEAGQADAEILAFLTERYGAFVLYDPPLDARTAVLWAGPPLLFLVGAAWLLRMLRHRGRRAAVAAPLDADTRAAVSRALAEDN
jgi:cytochrome c-type biogenesis protein CcmH